MTARTGVSIVPITSELVMSAPSQCVKWMIRRRGDSGEQILRAAREADDFMREDGPADENVVVLGDEAIQRDGNVLFESVHR